MTNINQIAYKLQKLRKMLNKPNPEIDEIIQSLHDIRQDMALVCAGRKPSIMLGTIINALNTTSADCAAKDKADELRDLLAEVLDEVKSMKMKKRICSVRRDIAKQRYCSSARETESELRLYDIIMAPTEGGFHYCILVHSDENSIYCLPYTTSCARSLRVLGRRYASTVCPVSGKDHVFLTNALTRIKIAEAQHHFICHHEPSAEELEAISELLSNKHMPAA